MPGRDETVFDFDVSPFIAGLNKIGRGMDSMTRNAKAMGDTITKSVGRAVNGAIVKVGALFAAFKSVGAVLKEMPEVGQAFGIAKDVFLKNLLWPLRQEVMPLLQRMLDWTRDNRATFARWGVAVANAFRTAATVAGTLWKVMKSLVDVLANSFQRAFKTSFKSFDEFVNVLSFKVSAVIIYMGMLSKQVVADLRPAFDWVVGIAGNVIGFFTDLVDVWTRANSNGNSLWTVLQKIGNVFSTLGTFISNAVAGFREGFIPAVSEMMTPLTDLFGALDDILNTLGLGDEQGVRGAFKWLGNFLGTGFYVALTLVSETAKNLAQILRDIRDAAEGIQALFGGDFKTAGEKLGGALKSASRNQTAVGTEMSVFSGESIEDGIVTKGGKVVRMSPQDNVYAFKGEFPPASPRARGPLQMSFGPFYVTTTEGNARAAGESFGRGLAGTIRSAMSSARLAEGY